MCGKEERFCIVMLNLKVVFALLTNFKESNKGSVPVRFSVVRMASMVGSMTEECMKRAYVRKRRAVLRKNKHIVSDRSVSVSKKSAHENSRNATLAPGRARNDHVKSQGRFSIIND